MSVTKYGTRFTELSCHVAFLIPTEVEKAKRFIDGLMYVINVNVSRESDMGTSF